MPKQNDTCRGCGRKLLYGFDELCQQCNTHIDNLIRQRLRRNPNKFTERPDIKKKYRLP